MTSTLTKILTFAAGALIGSAVTLYAVKGYYKKIADEEIESVKSMYVQKEEIEDSDQEIKPDETRSTSSIDLREYKKMVEEYKSKMEEENTMRYEPQVIAPDEFGDTGYNTIMLTYYEGDGVLASDYDDERIDIEDTIGYDSLQRFGEYENDIVHVRNDERKCDYEVTLDERCYSDINPEG